MEKLRIQGGTPLKGKIKISGSKNAALPIMTASLLTEETLSLYNLPHISDISTMANLLIHHGTEFVLGDIQNSTNKITLTSKNIVNYDSPYDIVKKMRASFLTLGPLIARFGEAKVSLPGGCAIGNRPIDLHLKALEALGVNIDLKDGYIIAKAPEGGIKGGIINFDRISVGATENILMAATLAKGNTVINNSAKEPEITDLAELLIKMGAKIKGIGTSVLTIEGVKKLNGASHRIISDRIEAGSFMIAAAITKGDIILTNINAKTLTSFIDKLKEAGVLIEVLSDDSIRIKGKNKIKAVDITTMPYPGFPTDLQAQFMALMILAQGSSIIKENIFENRFMHASELARTGANIIIDGHTAIVKGVRKLKGANLIATDLRASISLVIAALAAEGETIIDKLYHIDRGYERVEEKLSALGASIERIK